MESRNLTRSLALREKLFVLLFGTAFLALLLACIAFVSYDRSSSAEAKRSALSALARSVSHSAYGPTAFQDRDSAKGILTVLEHEPSAKAGGIYTLDGTLLAAWRRPSAAGALPARLRERERESGFGADELRLTTPISGPDERVGTLHVVFSTRDLQARTERLLSMAGAVLALSALLAFVLARRGQRLLTRPVQLLAAAAERVRSQRDLAARAERVSDDELGRLTDTFNAMLSTIEARDRELTEGRARLEALVQERTRDLERRDQELRLVLDSVGQGVVMLDRAGMPSLERSASFDRWFGAPEPGQTFASVLARGATGFDVQFSTQWEQLTDGFLPLALNLAQLPASLVTSDGNHYRLAYRPVGAEGDRFEKLLVVMSDVTEQVEQARRDARQGQLVTLLEHVSADRGGFLEFFREADALVSRTTSASRALSERATVLRELHTLKGNLVLFGFEPLAQLIHRIEEGCSESGELPTEAQRIELSEAWEELRVRAGTFLGDTRDVSVDRDSLDRLCAALRAERPHRELARLATRLTEEPVQPKLARIGERARLLADRLGKGPVTVDVQAHGVLAPENLNWLWQVLPHVVANSVDHGIDARAERLEVGKDAPAKLRIAAIESPSGIVIEIEDDGRGIDWHEVRSRAQRLGLPTGTPAELVEALFYDGVSTRDQAGEASGRGIGLAAVQAACAEHGARIGVESEVGKGTLFRFTVDNDNHETPRRGVA